MADISLTAEPFLGGFQQDFGTTALTEVTDAALMSIAQPIGGRDALKKAVKMAWGCSLPSPGQSAISSDENLRLLCLGPDSFLAIATNGTPVPKVIGQLGDSGYYTDQTDNWVMLRLKGQMAFAALERICPIDLHIGAFPKGAFARTSMEHLGAIVLREGQDDFLLMSTSSSAASFLHAVTTSLGNVA